MDHQHAAVEATTDTDCYCFYKISKRSLNLFRNSTSLQNYYLYQLNLHFCCYKIVINCYKKNILFAVLSQHLMNK